MKVAPHRRGNSAALCIFGGVYKGLISPQVYQRPVLGLRVEKLGPNFGEVSWLFVLDNKSVVWFLLICFGQQAGLGFDRAQGTIWMVSIVRMKALLEQLGLAAALKELPAATIAAYNNSQSEHIDEFLKLVGDLAAINTVISNKDQALLLLTSLPSAYDNFMETWLYGRDTLKLEDVLATLKSRELKKMTEAKGDGGEGLYVRGRSGQRDMGYNHKKSQGFVRNEDQVSGSGADAYDNADVMMAMSVEELLDWIMDSRSSYYITYRRGKVQVHMRDGSSFVLDNVRYVSKLRRDLISLGTLEKEGFIVKMHSGKIKVIKGSLVVLSGTRRANCVYTLDGQAVTMKTLKGRKQLGEYQTGWKIKTSNVLDSFNQRNIGFNESGKYKKTFIGSGVGTGSVQVLQGVEFEVEPQEDHTFEVEPHGNVDHIVGLQEVHIQDLIYYHTTRDREQHSACELFNYREDSNETAFVVAAVDKIYAHKSLTFNNTVACKVISKWKAGLKDGMDARSNVYVLNNGCKKCSDDNDVYYWEYIPGIRVGSLSRDCDVEKNGKWSCIHAVGSQEYQMVCMRLDIASEDVGILDKFDRGLQKDAHVFVDFDYAIGKTTTVMGRSIPRVCDTYRGCKGGYWAKGTRNRVKIRAKDSSGYCYMFLVRGYPWSNVHA
ncbi:hypothetical protein Tco_0991561 [Tanacetum coccineum]|uniref:Retrovirus-related Pol polyprotein from transposon TNT 1-94-like beta-barrel domain-containing protein n=1 Tax=Tanacetum coccineum TaxID=301880 RepID=A0ABQ5EZZ5_9ASTR